MKKTVLLITYTKSANYGAALQLYATYKFLEIMSFEVKVVNYQNAYENSQKSLAYLFSKSSLKQKIFWFISSYLFAVKRNSKQNFDSFYNTMKYTEEIHNVNELVNKADIFCVGSDQVWNPVITNGFDDVFMLACQLSGKKISYASSMGSIKFSGYDVKKFNEAIRDFDALSVRESIAAEYIRARHLNTVETVVDPTLLFNKKEWLDMCKTEKQRPIEGKYVLIYSLGGKVLECGKIANQLAKVIGAKVVFITLSNRKKHFGISVTDVTPFMFVNYISNASFVVTNSFHGTCFSLNLGTPFYSIEFNSNPMRVVELLTKLDLMHRFIGASSFNDVAINKDILGDADIITARKILEAESEKSKEWLANAVR